MLLTIDTEKKRIQLRGEVNLGDLQEELNKIVGPDYWDDWSFTFIEAETTTSENAMKWTRNKRT